MADKMDLLQINYQPGKGIEYTKLFIHDNILSTLRAPSCWFSYLVLKCKYML